MIDNREVQPPFFIPETVNILHPTLLEAANGIKLYTINATDLDVVRLSLVFRAGTRFQNRPFLASATLNLLSEGTAKYSAGEISEKIDFYGAYFDVNIDRDYSVISMCCLSRFLPDMLETLEQIVVHPSFAESELELYKAKRKQQLTIEREKVSFHARELFGEALFGKKHPYGVFSPVEDYDTLNTKELKSFYHKFYNADNCFAVTSGNISVDEQSMIAKFLECMPSGNEPVFTELPLAKSVEKVYEKRENCLQSAIRVGKLMFPRSHPDYIGMQLLIMILGGYFGSRLVSNLREEKGYTYGIYSTMVNLESEGYMAIATEVGSEFTDSAVSEIFAEIARLRNELIDSEEMNVVKNIITGELMRILDGPFGIADVTIENIQCKTNNDYLNQFLCEIKSITPEELMQLAKKHLSDDGFVTVIVGDSQIN